MSMIIKRLVNNNVVIAEDKKNGEVVIMGNGLGFGVGIGQRVDKKKIEKLFILNRNSKLTELLQEIPPKYLGLTEDIVLFAKNNYDITLDNSIYLILTNHIYYAMKRLQEGIIIANPFVYEIENYYRKAWNIGVYAQKRLYEMTNINIGNDEIAFIAIYIIEADTDTTYQNIKKKLDLINQLMNIIKKKYPFIKNENSISYKRLMIHIKFFVERYLCNVENTLDDSLFDEKIIRLFKNEYICVNSISDFLKDNYGRSISTSEANYLILHLRNCKNLDK